MKKKPNDFQILNVSNYIRYNNIGTRRHTQKEMGVVLIKIFSFFRVDPPKNWNGSPLCLCVWCNNKEKKR
jgi:hypothetical protein